MAFARGFKARCENMAETIRRELGRRPYDVVSATELAAYVGARLIAPSDIPGMSESSLRVLLKDDREDWSAATISDASELPIVIYNPANSLGRRSSDIAHELAHVLLRHEPSKLILTPDLTWALRSYDGPAEAEAAWLSGCLLLPRPALLQIAEMDLSSRVAAARYVVSEQLLGYRKAVTAVTRELERRRAAGRR